MTTAVNDTVERYTISGVGPYAFNFRIFDEDELTVIAITSGVPATLSGYTVSGVNVRTGGTITLTAGDAATYAGSTLDIRSNTTLNQPTSIRNQGDFLPETHEDAFDRLSRQIQDLDRRLHAALRLPEYLNTDGEMSPVSAWLNRYAYVNSSGQLEPAANIGTTTITQSIIAGLLNPATPGENSAGAVPLYAQLEPGIVDRYQRNDTPLTTNMTDAFNKAIQVAARKGCEVMFGERGPYLCMEPINATQVRGITIRDYSSADASSGNAGLVIGHTGHGIDMAGSTEISLVNLTAKNLPGVVPKTLLFMSRIGPGSAPGAGQHRIINLRTTSASRWKNTAYQYGAEENQYWGCILYNVEPGSSLVNINGSNPSSYASSFVSVATGEQSNAEHKMFGCNLFNAGNDGAKTEVCVQLEKTANFAWNGGLWYTLNGAAYVRVVGTGACNFLTLRDIRGETGGGTNTYGILVATTGTTGGSAHSHWKLSQLGLNCTASGIYCENGAELQNLDIDTLQAATGHLLDVYNMGNSRISHGSNIVTGRSGGNVSSNSWSGWRSNVTLSGTHTNNIGLDTATGRTWEDDDSYTAPATACTGALVVLAQYSARKHDAQVTLTLPLISATATAAANFVINPALPVAYRPPQDVEFEISISDNSARVAGYVKISTAGVITVSKSTGANFTAAAGAGLPAAKPLTWNL